MKLHCYFARGVTAAMLVTTNKIVNLLWELKAILDVNYSKYKFINIQFCSF